MVRYLANVVKLYQPVKSLLLVTQVVFLIFAADKME